MTKALSLSMKTMSIAENEFDASEAADRLAAMKHQEDMLQTNSSLSRRRSFSADGLVIDQGCRTLMCDWCYKVIDYVNFQRETVFIAMSYLDRFLVSEAGRPFLDSHSMFQLAAVTCLHMAVKLHEPKCFDLDLLVKLARDCYTVDQILEMELIILKALQWRMHPLTPMDFVQHIIALIPSIVDPVAKQCLFNVAVFQTELSVFDVRLSKQRASSVAVAAILNAVEVMDRTLFAVSWRTTIENSLSQIGISSAEAGVREARRELSIALAEQNHLFPVSCRTTTEKHFSHIRIGNAEAGVREARKELSIALGEGIPVYHHHAIKPVQKPVWCVPQKESSARRHTACA